MTRHIVFVELSATGAGQRCLEYARGRGYTSTVLARRQPGAVAAAASRVVECDTDDDDELLDRVHRLARCHPVDGVTTTHDLYVPQAALVAETLGLPGLARRAALGVRNKHRMRLALQSTHPRLNPPFRLVRTAAEAAAAAADLGYPLVGKPQDANDSWQVVRLDGDDDVAGYLRSAGDWPDHPLGDRAAPGVLLEGYLDGPEFTVETAQHRGGEIELIGVSGKEWAAGDDRHFAELAAYFPVGGPMVAELFSEVAKALHALGIDCGVVHTECRVVDGQVKILEINPRLTGDLMGSHAIELALGASPVQQVVEIALGNPAPWRPTRRRGAAIVGVCGPAGQDFPGIVNLDQVRAMPGVAVVRVAAEPGARVNHPPRSNLDFVAWIVTSAPAPAEALALAYRAAGAVRFR